MSADRKPRDEVLFPPFGPAMIISVDHAIYQVLTWQGRVLHTNGDSLQPFPTVPAATDPTMSVPDYSVEGVSEIVELSVDFDIEPPRRIKSSLYPLFMKLEQEAQSEV
jgi:hypothetical protein